MMRPTGVWREVARNIRSGTTRTLLLATASIVVGSVLVLVDIGDVRQLLDEAETYQRSGAATLTLVAPGRVDGESCAALERVDGVLEAGAIRQSTDTLKAVALPDAPLSTFEVTPDFPGILTDSRSLAGGVVVSRDVANTLGVQVGEAFAERNGTANVTGVFDYPSDGRRPGFGWAALIRSNYELPFDECWAYAWPQQPELRALLTATLTPAVQGADDDPPQVAQLNASLGWQFGGSDRLTYRMTGYSPLIASLFAVVLAAVAIRLRRLEIASNLHAGAMRRDVISMMLAESASWAVPAAVITTAITLIISAPVASGDRTALIIEGLKTPIGLITGTLVGTLIATALVHERHLFVYFKERR